MAIIGPTEMGTFAEHDELKHDVLNFLEVVGNIFDNKIDELVAQQKLF